MCQSHFFILNKPPPDGEHNSRQILNRFQLTQSPKSSGHANLNKIPVWFPHPTGLTPVRDHVEACSQAKADAVLVVFVSDLAVAHPDPVALLEQFSR